MKKAITIIVCLLLVLGILGGCYWYFFLYRQNLTTDGCVRLAERFAAEGRYSRAVTFYNTAYALDPSRYDIAIALAETYAADDNYTKAEYTLVNAIADHPEITELYLALSRTFVAQDKLLDAQEMLDHIGNDKVRQEIESMRPEAPTLSPESGYYDDYISVSLTYTSGIPYLRTDGEYPSTRKPSYSQPVTLTDGENTVTAVVLGENGLVSRAVCNGYTIGHIIEKVSFHSAEFEEMVRQALALPGGDIMTDDLWGVTELNVPDTVQDISDLSYFTGLTSLTLQNYHEGDYSFLPSLTQLEALDLTESSVSTQTLELIGALSSLKRLYLDSCGISDVTALGQLTSLTELHLAGNSLSGISPLSGCRALEILDLSSAGLSDLSPLASLHNLSELNLSYNQPATLVPLASCPKLRKIDLSNCELTDISVLGSCTQLTHLTAAHNTLTGIAGIERCTALQEVDLSYNKLTSIDELGPIDSITYVNINENDVVSLPPFHETSQLQRFYADHNFLEDLSGLSSLTYLNYVTLDYNNITTIDALADCINLVQVNVFHTNISSAEEVKALTDRSIIVNFTPRYDS